MSINAKSPFDDIQNAIYTLLAGNITGGGPYDEVPAAGTFPYTTFGNPVDSPFEARGISGRIAYITFNIWSRDYGGRQECYTIMDEIVQLMTASTLTITGWHEVWKHFEPSRVERLKEEDADFLGVLPFEICVVQT